MPKLSSGSVPTGGSELSKQDRSTGRIRVDGVARMRELFGQRGLIVPETPARAFITDRSGGAAMMFALMLVPLMLFAGAGVDMMRAVELRTQMQAIADTAALAGATAYGPAGSKSQGETAAKNYVTSSKTYLPENAGFVSSVNCTSALNGCTVSLSASLSTSIMAILMSSVPVSVTATAQSQTYNLEFSFGKFASSAWDFNAIYWYVIPSDGGIPSSTDLTLLYCNSGCSNSNPTPPKVSGNQKIGFLLRNVTGGIVPYPVNGYGSALGHANMFYSHLSPPSSLAYPSSTKNCNLQIAATSSPSATPADPTSGSCLSTTPSLGTLNCAQNSGKTMTYTWNDMGGGIEDYDFNDAIYKVSCSASGSSTQSGVVLTK